MMAPGLSLPALLHPLHLWSLTTTKGITRGIDTTPRRTTTRLVVVRCVIDVDYYSRTRRSGQIDSFSDVIRSANRILRNINAASSSPTPSYLRKKERTSVSRMLMTIDVAIGK